MADATLIQKLRMTDPGSSLVLNCPAGILERLQPVQTKAGERPAGFLLLFVHNQAQLATLLPEAIAALDEKAVFWIAYPKKSSAITSDINRDAGWEPVFAAGYGPVSQIAIDATFSALRFRPEKDIRRKEGSVFNSRT